MNVYHVFSIKRQSQIIVTPLTLRPEQAPPSSKHPSKKSKCRAHQKSDHKLTVTKLKCIQTEAVARRCSVKMVFLEISQNSQENTCARVSFLIKLQAVPGLRPATLLKKRLRHRCFPVNFAKFLRTPFLTEHLRWLLLYRTSV